MKKGHIDFKLKYAFVDTYGNSDCNSLQFLTGITVSTRQVGRKKNLNFYSSLRFGLGINALYYYYRNNSDAYESDVAVAMEWDLGIRSKHLFVGIGAGASNVFTNVARHDADGHYLGLRVGWDFGRRKSY